MALLRNRPVQILGPVGPSESPIYTVQYSDGTREDTPLKFIEMSESEHKDWSKANPSVADHPHVIDDKDHQKVLDSQNPRKIEEDRKKNPDQSNVEVPLSSVKVSRDQIERAGFVSKDQSDAQVREAQRTVVTPRTPVNQPVRK